MLLFERPVLANLRFDDIAVYGLPLQEAKLGQLLRIELTTMAQAKVLELQTRAARYFLAAKQAYVLPN